MKATKLIYTVIIVIIIVNSAPVFILVLVPAKLVFVSNIKSKSNGAIKIVEIIVNVT